MLLIKGTILNNRYCIVRLLGTGGFGAMFYAWDISFEMPYTLKENTEVSPETQRQFLQEAKNLGTLHHPRISNQMDQRFDYIFPV